METQLSLVVGRKCTTFPSLVNYYLFFNLNKLKPSSFMQKINNWFNQ
jgi:hypothetical protein